MEPLFAVAATAAIEAPGALSVHQESLIPMNRPVQCALADFKARRQPGGWQDLAFFRDGSVERVAAKVDAVVAGGAQVLPDPTQIFAALDLTPLDRVKVVILGQDPYPTPGYAHGLAFSCRGTGRLPASLRTILVELVEDIDVPPPTSGDLSAWAQQGVLLLNTALTVEAGHAGSHLRFGWSSLVDQAVAAVSGRRPAVAFLLWGNAARSRASLVDRRKHLVIESGHPSPLNRLRDFRRTRPFSRANAWLEERGLAPVDWRL